jgi:hypothetical protein
MSFSSKPRKIKAKGTVRELKVVQSVNRRGADVLITEEVKTPKKKATTTRQRNHSSSPIKRPKLDDFDGEPVPLYLGGPDTSNKRPTMVCLFPL